MLDERAGVGGVPARTIEGDVPGLGRETDERAHACFELAKTTAD